VRRSRGAAMKDVAKRLAANDGVHGYAPVARVGARAASLRCDAATVVGAALDLPAREG
jgi:hypothetical protein